MVVLIANTSLNQTCFTVSPRGFNNRGFNSTRGHHCPVPWPPVTVAFRAASRSDICTKTSVRWDPGRALLERRDGEEPSIMWV